MGDLSCRAAAQTPDRAEVVLYERVSSSAVRTKTARILTRCRSVYKRVRIGIDLLYRRDCQGEPIRIRD